MKLASFSSKASHKRDKPARDRDSGFATNEVESDNDLKSIPAHTTVTPLPPHTDHLSAHSDNIINPSTQKYILQADQAIEQIKQLTKARWKRVLMHKSGVKVETLQGQPKNSNTTTFKGETIIEGFSPQSIFYVVGMRRLWDDQFEEGRLIENLNETTSLTYETFRSGPSSSRCHDTVLAEKIDCSTNGTIYFACTSVDTVKVPKIPGKSRRHVKLQGWILEPLCQNQPSTRITFMTEERVHGWIPGLTKKSLAKRPLVIASIHKFLQEKAQSVMEPSAFTTTLSARSHILSTPPHVPPFLSAQALRPPTIKHAPAFLPKIGTSAHTHIPLHINFADETTLQPTINCISPVNPSALCTEPVLEPNAPSLEMPSLKPLRSSIPTSKLYPSCRHRIARQECIDTLKRLTASDLDEWNFISETNHVQLHSKAVSKSVFPILRGDGVIKGPWTTEQVCTAIQTFGSRKKWDEHFETGHTVERFSQKEYLVYTQMRSLFPIQSRDFSLLTTIEHDTTTGAIYVASTSVSDDLIPESDKHVRGKYLIHGWALQPLSDMSGVKAKFISHMDLGGVTPLPSAIVRMLTNAVPACISRVQDYLGHYGCPPYIRRVAGKVVREDFDTETRCYSVHYTVKHRPSTIQFSKRSSSSIWCTVIQTHSSVYKSGFNVQTIPETGISIELGKNGTGLRIYTETNDLEGQTVKVNIMPRSPHKPVQFTWNGTALTSYTLPANMPFSKIDKIDQNCMPLSRQMQHAKLHVFPKQDQKFTLAFSNELAFSGPQMYIIFVFMVVCYYLGKLSCR